MTSHTKISRRPDTVSALLMATTTPINKTSTVLEGAFNVASSCSFDGAGSAGRVGRRSGICNSLMGRLPLGTHREPARPQSRRQHDHGHVEIWLSSSHISQGIAKMNDSYSMNLAEKQHVICQEIGHTFGLAHQSEDGSSQNTCMDYYQNKSDTDTTSTHPNQHDYDELAIIYAHLDSFNSAFGIGGNLA